MSSRFHRIFDTKSWLLLPNSYSLNPLNFKSSDMDRCCYLYLMTAHCFRMQELQHDDFDRVGVDLSAKTSFDFHQDKSTAVIVHWNAEQARPVWDGLVSMRYHQDDWCFHAALIVSCRRHVQRQINTYNRMSCILSTPSQYDAASLEDSLHAKASAGILTTRTLEHWITKYWSIFLKVLVRAKC